MTTDKLSISYLHLRCPTDMPVDSRPQCFYNPSSCERCLYPAFREKIEDDERTRQEVKRTILEEMNLWQKR